MFMPYRNGPEVKAEWCLAYDINLMCGRSRDSIKFCAFCPGKQVFAQMGGANRGNVSESRNELMTVANGEDLRGMSGMLCVKDVHRWDLMGRDE